MTRLRQALMVFGSLAAGAPLLGLGPAEENLADVFPAHQTTATYNLSSVRKMTQTAQGSAPVATTVHLRGCSLRRWNTSCRRPQAAPPPRST